MGDKISIPVIRRGWLKDHPNVVIFPGKIDARPVSPLENPEVGFSLDLLMHENIQGKVKGFLAIALLSDGSYQTHSAGVTNMDNAAIVGALELLKHRYLLRSVDPACYDEGEGES